ncbi:MAG TPA: glycerol-3-phosphate acyltransferase [Acidimicrobiia bacterium]|jgi:glycerol-3-phosphate acyltransferase PlsY|nr:glycerol-3-phosphate acyltransferase [Acidimicrobiia bacterium]
MPVISSPIMYWPLMLLGAYVLGSIPFAQVMARLRGVDLRQVGSGNVGAGNLTRTVGVGWGVTAAVLDGLKGLVPVWLALRYGLGPGAAGLVGVAAVIGHNWSIFMRGRSGRGLAPAAGLLLALNPAMIVWTTGWSLAGWKIGGGLAGFLGWGLLPIVSVALGNPVTESILILLLSAVLIGRRMQGNVGDYIDTASMMRRAVYDTDRVEGSTGGEAADDPLTP